MLRRFSLVVGMGVFVALLWGGFSAPTAAALPTTAGATSVASPLAQTADILDIGDLDCHSDTGAINVDVGITSGIDIDLHPDAFVTDYILCPLAGMLYNGVGLILNVIQGSGLLEVKPLLKNGSPSDDTAGMYAAWSVFRDVANFGLIVGMFLVIFSQATSYGLSAYGVRKMLPKIIIAALLVNMSYILCAVMVDIFNILGASLDDILSTAIGNRVSNAGGINLSIGTILSTAAVGVMAAFGGPIIILAVLMLLLILVILIIMGVLSVFFLIARQVLIVILIIIAPLACIAWLFPNTEQQFRRWWSTLIRLLAIYPVVMCLNTLVLILLVALNALMESV